MAEYKTADANDFPEEFRKVEPIEVSVGLDPNIFGVGQLRPDLDGFRITPGGAIYLVLDGKLCHIPNPPTYNNLFRGWDGIITESNLYDIAWGSQLSDGALLAVPNEGGTVYLISNSIKRAIAGPAAMDKYYFSWERIVRVPRVFIDAIPTGQEIS